MSGGSYSYLSSYQLDGAPDNLRAMSEALMSDFRDSRAAEDTAKLVAMYASIRELAEKLDKVWHAVEWWHSGDWSREQAEDAVRLYEDAPGHREQQFPTKLYTEALALEVQAGKLRELAERAWVGDGVLG